MCDVDGALVQAWAGISVHHHIWDLLCQGCPKPTQPPDGGAGPRGSIRSWTSPPEPIHLSFPLSFPPSQALEVVCCRRWAETCRAVGCLDKGPNALLQLRKPGIKEAQSHLFHSLGFPFPQRAQSQTLINSAQHQQSTAGCHSHRLFIGMPSWILAYKLDLTDAYWYKQRH